ncbi:MAG: ABC transporter permease [Candidatus Coprovivens sp.]
MKQYISYFKLKFSTGLQYKSAAIAGMLTQIFFGLVFVMVYIAFYSNGTNNLEMTLKELIPYLWLNQAFFSLISVWHKDNEILSMIRKGDVAYELCRPQNLYIMWFIRILTSKLSAVLLRCPLLLIVSLLLPSPYNLTLPANPIAFISFIITLVISSLLITAIVTLIYILIFYSIDNKGIMGMYCSIAEILSGQVIPIPLFPTILKNIAILLPFAYISDFSFRIYTGNIYGLDIIKGLIVEITWLIILIIVGAISTNSILKRVSVQGG